MSRLWLGIRGIFIGFGLISAYAPSQVVGADAYNYIIGAVRGVMWVGLADVVGIYSK